VGFVVLKQGWNGPARRSWPSCVPWCATASARLAALQAGLDCRPAPKTRSGKILRGTMRQIADGEEWRIPATIDDPAALDEVAPPSPPWATPRQAQPETRPAPAGSAQQVITAG